MRILITGGSGFVARNLAIAMTASGHHVLALPKAALNIGDEQSVRQALTGFEPDVLLNCAGDKDLQRCEDDPERCWRLNAQATAMMARVCLERDVRFVHFGSDHAYSEPLTAYGASKRAGDETVMHANRKALVCVTGHVYDRDCPWIRWLDGELRRGEPVLAWADLYNWPTYTPNLAAMVLDLVNSMASGVHACLGSQRVNRQELFQWYAVAAGLDATLISPAPYACASALHPRLFVLPKRGYMGKVRRMTVAEGMQAMCRGLLKEGVAA